MNTRVDIHNVCKYNTRKPVNRIKSDNVIIDARMQKNPNDILSAMNMSGSQMFQVLKTNSKPKDIVQTIESGNITTTTTISGKQNNVCGQSVPESVSIKTKTVKPDGSIKLQSTVTKPVYEINGINDVDLKAFNHINNFDFNGKSISGCHNSEFYEKLLNLPTNETIKEHLNKFGYNKTGEYGIEKVGKTVQLSIPVSGASKKIEIEKIADNAYTTSINGVKINKTCCSNASELKEFYDNALSSFNNKNIPKVIRTKDVENPINLYFEMPVKLANGTKKLAAGYIDLAKKIPLTIFPIDKPTLNKMYHCLLR